VINLYRVGPKWRPSFPTCIPNSRSKAIEEDGESHAEVRVYSDRSSVDGGIRAVAVLYRDGSERRMLRVHLGSDEEHTVFEGELVGLLLATELIIEERGVRTATIGADNQAAIQAMKSSTGAPGYHLVDRLHEQMTVIQHKHPAHGRAQVDARA